MEMHIICPAKPISIPPRDVHHRETANGELQDSYGTKTERNTVTKDKQEKKCDK